MNLLPPTFVENFHSENKLKELTYRPLGRTHMVVSQIGLGSGPFGNHYEKNPVSPELVREIVLTALKSGVNYLDTAPYYGGGTSEEKLGFALKGIPRKAYYLSSKVGRYDWAGQGRFDYTSKRVRQSVEKSLRVLNTSYLDLVFIHDVEFVCSFEQILKHTLPTLKELKAEGKIKAIGMSSYPLGPLKQLVKLAPKGSFDVVLSYCRATLFNKDFLDEIEFFVEKGVGLINAAPIGMGLLAADDQKWHPASNINRKATREAFMYAQEKGFSLAKLAIQWCLNLSTDALPMCLLGVLSVPMMEEAILAAREELTKEEKDIIEEINEKFFKYLPINNWENIELFKYWEDVEANQWAQPTDLCANN